MGRRLPSPYEYFGATEEELNEILDELNEEDKELFYERYGKNLHSPVSSKTFNASKANDYYNELAPRMREILDEIRERQLQDYSEEAILEIMEEMDEIEQEPDRSFEEKLVGLIDERKSNREICRELGIDSNELYEKLVDLKNNGREIVTKYYSDGSIRYGLAHSLGLLNTIKSMGNFVTLFSDPREKNMKFLIISDLHFGNEKDRLDLINSAFEYCVKNDIHSILCGGDLIDGTYTEGSQKISDVRKQLDFFVENYPRQDGILTFSVAGDRDASALTSAGLNISRLCEAQRPDVVIGGYENMFLNVKDDQIKLHHNINSLNSTDGRSPIILHGKSHFYKVVGGGDKLNVYLPTLSDVNSNNPSALELEVSFKEGLFSTTNIRQLDFNKKDVIQNEFDYDLYSESRKDDRDRHNEERYLRGNSKVLQRTSQIDKFNNKWNKK